MNAFLKKRERREIGLFKKIKDQEQREKKKIEKGKIINEKLTEI
jgi:hypothetical protein